MKPLVLHPTDVCQWQALIHEAQASTCLILNESTESYLVFLLMRFSKKPAMESILALDFLEYLHKPRTLRWDALKDIGDKSLLFSGLFPGLAQKQMVSIDYFSRLGKIAYSTLGGLSDDESSQMYLDLSAQFSRLQQILQAIRGEYVLYNMPHDGFFSSDDFPPQ